MQKSLIIRDDNNELCVKELNGYLEEGWKVIETCPMPSSCTGMVGHYEPTCLVVLEKIEIVRGLRK